MTYAQDIISKFQNAIVQKSRSLLDLSQSADIYGTANNMETSGVKPSNMRRGENKIPSFNNCKFGKLVKKYEIEWEFYEISR